MPLHPLHVTAKACTYPRSRWLYFAFCVFTILIGLSTRLFRGTGAAEVAANAGDALWAVLVYLGYGVLFPRAHPWVLAGLAAVTATCVEFSQLYHAPWIDAVRRTTLGGLALGYGFSWGDLLCYYAGAGACLLAEQVRMRLQKHPQP